MLSPFVLRVVAAADESRAGQELPVGGPATIGRDPACTFMLDDKSVSRQHARVEPLPQGLRVVDLGSGNGVWVGSKKVSDVVLRPGEQFRVGTTTFECGVPGQAVATAVLPPTGHAPPPAARESRTGTTRTASSPSAGDRWPAHPSPCDRRRRSRRGRPTEYVVDKDAAIVGRSESCDIVVAARDVSRRHGRIERTTDGLRIDRSRQRRRRLARDEPGLGGVRPSPAITSGWARESCCEIVDPAEPIAERGGPRRRPKAQALTTRAGPRY